MCKEIFFDEDEDIIDICFDNVFKAVFTKDSPQSRGALSKLVSALIGRNVTIVSILENEPPPDSIGDRQIRYDINCRTENSELVDVEMSLNSKAYEPVRLEFHAARLFSGQNIRGKDKNYDDLKQAYQIAILVNDKFFPDENFIHAFEYYDPIRSVPLNGRSRIIALELSKLEKVVEKEITEMNVQEQWAVYFKYLTDREKRGKINSIITHEEGIAMASEVVMTISKDEEERALLMLIEKNELDRQSELSWARREGRLEGEKEGELKIINMLKSGKAPEEIIAEYGE
jgi:predicted transposase/invertase (TIGR01784 family)